MFAFDKESFISKVKKQGIDIMINPAVSSKEYAFILPHFYEELSGIKAVCFYIESENILAVHTIMPISEKVLNETANLICETMNPIAKFGTMVQIDEQGRFLVSGMQVDFTKIDYSDDDDALEYAASFVVFFKQEFERYGYKAYMYASTGNINYLSN